MNNYKKFKRIFVIVADSMGVGEAKDSAVYSDAGANTFGHVAEGYSGFSVPTLEKLGIGNITDISKCYSFNLNNCSKVELVLN